MRAFAKSLLPQEIHAFLRRSVYSHIPLKKRMGKNYWQLRAFLAQAQWWNREQIEAWQLEKMKKMVHHAYQNVPGYRTLYQEAGVKPDDIISLADVQLLPFITKELLRDNIKDFVARNIPGWKLRFVTTGGSTGIPLGYYHTDVNLWMEDAFMHQGWERTGWQLEDVSAVLRGGFTGSQERIWDYDPVRFELNLSSYFLAEQTYQQYMNIFQEYKPRYLQAYPSAVTLLADLVLNNNDVGRIGIKAILLGSEGIYDWQKDKLSRAFPDAQLFGWYGHSEQAILAPMCEYSDQYHVWPFYGFTEIVKDGGGLVNVGEVGELVGTSFWSEGTPFIRYRTGDLAERGQIGCARCNRQFEILTRIEGRKQDYVVTTDGGYVTLTALIFAQHFHAFGSIINMQLYQDRVGEVLVKVVPTSAFSDQDINEIKTTMEGAVGGRLNVRVQIVDEIPRTQRGKYRFLEQKLDIKYGE